MRAWDEISKDRRLFKRNYGKDGTSGSGYVITDPKHVNRSFSVIWGRDEGGWEHVSVDGDGRDPTWEEMCVVKDIFWEPEEECIQFHPKKSQYVNMRKHCLHIWRRKDGGLFSPHQEAE